jgi:hypothetical protein
MARGDPGRATGIEKLLSRSTSPTPYAGWLLTLEQETSNRRSICIGALIEVGAARSPKLFYNAGLIYEARADEMPRCSIASVEGESQSGEALLNLGHADMDMGQEDGARSCWRKAVGEL